MEIPQEKQQLPPLTLTMRTNMSSRHCPRDGPGDGCVGVCFSVVPALPRPVLFCVLTMGKFAGAVGLLSLLPASHHQTVSVYKWLSEEVLCSVRASECVYLCEHDPGLRHVKRSSNKCGRSTYQRHIDQFSRVQT